MTYGEACAALARAVGEAAQVGPGSTVFDCGFGCGDQLQIWRDMGAAQADGVTPSRCQLQVATERAASAGFNASRLLLGSSDDLDTRFPERGRYDSVVAVDCAYHFTPSRRSFFTSSHRLLRTGGGLGLTDMVLGIDPDNLTPLSLSWWRLLPLRLLLVFGGVPWDNHAALPRYLADLEGAGFTVTSVTDLSQDVFEGFADYFDRLIGTLPAPLVRAIPMRFKMVARGARSLAKSGRIRYILVQARKN